LLEASKARYDAVVKLIEEHGQLYGWVHHFEAHLLQALKTDLAALLARVSLRQLRRPLGQTPAGRLVGKAFGLEHKLEYFNNMLVYLQGELRDRRGRVQAIEQTRALWLRKPYERLTRDKTKWLITTPQAKQQGTAKRLRWMRQMHRNVFAYEAWDEFDLFLYEADDFYPYDAFGYGSEEAMPWEGFAREVLPTLAPYRESHGLEKKDYSLFKELEQNAERSWAVEGKGDGAGTAQGAGGPGVGDVATGAAIAAVAAVAASEMLEAAEVADLS
jgi:hypothetical protein